MVSIAVDTLCAEPARAVVVSGNSVEWRVREAPLGARLYEIYFGDDCPFQSLDGPQPIDHALRGTDIRGTGEYGYIILYHGPGAGSRSYWRVDGNEIIVTKSSSR